MKASNRFVHLLNAFEIASGCETPTDHGYAEKHQAVLDYVANLENRAGYSARQSRLDEWAKHLAPALLQVMIPRGEYGVFAEELWEIAEEIDSERSRRIRAQEGGEDA